MPTMLWGQDLGGIGQRAGLMNATKAEKEWSDQHVGMQSHLLAPLPKPDKAGKQRRHRKCWQAGFCICKGRGLKLLTCHQRLQNLLKSQFNETKHEKRLLFEGFVVVEIITAPLDSDLAMDIALFDSGGSSRFYQIGLHYASPIRSTFSSLARCTDFSPQLGGILLRSSFEVVKVSVADLDEHPPFGSWWQAVAQCDLRQRVFVQCWQLAESERPLNRNFCPGVIEVVRLGGVSSCIWKGSAHEKIRRRPAKRRRGALEDLDDVSDGSGGSGDEGTSNSSAGTSSSGGRGSDEGGDNDPLDAALLEAADASNSDGEDGVSPVGSSLDGLSDEYRSVHSDELCSGLSEIGSEPDSGSERGRGHARRAPHDADHPAERRAQDGLSVFDGIVEASNDCLKYNVANDNFYIKCCNPAHDRCILTRSAHGGRRVAQGRPIGALAAWVIKAFEFDTAASHKRDCRPSHAERLRARRDLLQGGQEALARLFFEKERPKHDDEGSEPELFP
jgi:hypothetical protein